MKIVEFKYFYPEKPRLIHKEQPLFKTLSKSTDWVAEKKFNETRLALHLLNRQAQFWNRHGERMAYIPTPEIKDMLDALMEMKLPEYTLFDGGLRHNRTKDVRNKIMIWDVFIWNGELMIGKPFWYRRQLIESLFNVDDEPIGVPAQYPNGFQEIFEQVIHHPEIEGLVMKNKKGMLNLGRKDNLDSKWMYKVRRPSGRYLF